MWAGYAILLDHRWIRREAKNIEHVRYFPHGLAKRISHPTFDAQESKLPREAKTGTETTAGTEYVCVRRLRAWAMTNLKLRKNFGTESITIRLHPDLQFSIQYRLRINSSPAFRTMEFSEIAYWPSKPVIIISKCLAAHATRVFISNYITLSIFFSQIEGSCILKDVVASWGNPVDSEWFPTKNKKNALIKKPDL